MSHTVSTGFVTFLLQAHQTSCPPGRSGRPSAFPHAAEAFSTASSVAHPPALRSSSSDHDGDLAPITSSKSHGSALWLEPTLQIVDAQLVPTLTAPAVVGVDDDEGNGNAPRELTYFALSDGAKVLWSIVPPDSAIQGLVQERVLDLGGTVTLHHYEVISAANGKPVLVLLDVSCDAEETLSLIGNPSYEAYLGLSPMALRRGGTLIARSGRKTTRGGARDGDEDGGPGAGTQLSGTGAAELSSLLDLWDDPERWTSRGHRRAADASSWTLVVRVIWVGDVRRVTLPPRALGSPHPTANGGRSQPPRHHGREEGPPDHGGGTADHRLRCVVDVRVTDVDGNVAPLTCWSHIADVSTVELMFRLGEPIRLLRCGLKCTGGTSNGLRAAAIADGPDVAASQRVRDGMDVDGDHRMVPERLVIQELSAASFQPLSEADATVACGGRALPMRGLRELGAAAPVVYRPLSATLRDEVVGATVDVKGRLLSCGAVMPTNTRHAVVDRRTFVLEDLHDGTPISVTLWGGLSHHAALDQCAKLASPKAAAESCTNDDLVGRSSSASSSAFSARRCHIVLGLQHFRVKVFGSSRILSSSSNSHLHILAPTALPTTTTADVGNPRPEYTVRSDAIVTVASVDRDHCHNQHPQQGRWVNRAPYQSSISMACRAGVAVLVRLCAVKRPLTYPACIVCRKRYRTSGPSDFTARPTSRQDASAGSCCANCGAAGFQEQFCVMALVCDGGATEPTWVAAFGSPAEQLVSRAMALGARPPAAMIVGSSHDAATPAEELLPVPTASTAASKAVRDRLAVDRDFEERIVTTLVGLPVVLRLVSPNEEEEDPLIGNGGDVGRSIPPRDSHQRRPDAKVSDWAEAGGDTFLPHHAPHRNHRDDIIVVDVIERSFRDLSRDVLARIVDGSAAGN